MQHWSRTVSGLLLTLKPMPLIHFCGELPAANWDQDDQRTYQDHPVRSSSLSSTPTSSRGVSTSNNVNKLKLLMGLGIDIVVAYTCWTWLQLRLQNLGFPLYFQHLGVQELLSFTRRCEMCWEGWSISVMKKSAPPEERSSRASISRKTWQVFAKPRNKRTYDFEGPGRRQLRLLQFSHLFGYLTHGTNFDLMSRSRSDSHSIERSKSPVQSQCSSCIFLILLLS